MQACAQLGRPPAALIFSAAPCRPEGKKQHSIWRHHSSILSNSAAPKELLSLELCCPQMTAKGGDSGPAKLDSRNGISCPLAGPFNADRACSSGDKYCSPILLLLRPLMSGRRRVQFYYITHFAVAGPARARSRRARMKAQQKWLPRCSVVSAETIYQRRRI